MIRVIVQTDDANMAAHVGGSPHTFHKTFDIESADLESYLREMIQYGHRQVIGVEVMP